MKLSKEELIDLLYGVGTDWGPSEYVYRAERVIDALKTNTLEIEGYERKDHFPDATKMVETNNELKQIQAEQDTTK